MTTNMPVTQQQGQLLEQVLIGGDLAKLKPEDRVFYYKQVCESVGLNPLTKPFEYITLNGKLTLYALRTAAEQLRKVHKVSVVISSRELIGDVYTVTAKATDATGRQDESIGAVNVGGLKGDALANAYMKCETKAKRRVTLSICGLGMLDETEVDSIPGAYPQPITPTAGYLASQPAARQEVLNETAQEVKALFGNDQAADAYALIENSGFDAEEMIALWSLLPSNIRSAMKRMKEAETAADKGTISPAQKKRLEAIIKESGKERDQVKGYCHLMFGKDHFSELTPAEMKMLEDDYLNAPAPAALPGGPSPSRGGVSGAPNAAPQDRELPSNSLVESPCDSRPVGAAPDAEYITPDELLDIEDRLKVAGLNKDRLLAAAKVTSLAKLPANGGHRKALAWIQKAVDAKRAKGVV